MPRRAWWWILLGYWLFFLFHDVSPHASPSNRKRTERKQGKLIVYFILWGQKGVELKEIYFALNVFGVNHYQAFRKPDVMLNNYKILTLLLSLFTTFFFNNKNHIVRKYVIKKKKTEFAYILLCHHTNTSKCLCQHRQFCGRDTVKE